MTAPIDKHRQIADLLPLYSTGRLEEVNTRVVSEHLLACVRCRQELANWESIKSATRMVPTMRSLPSASLMDAVWTKIDEPVEAMRKRERWSIGRSLRQLWLIFRSQIALLHKSIWVASALVCLLGLILTLWMGFHTQSTLLKQASGQLLVLFIVVSGASGCAFIYGSAVDPGFEWTLSTPTSIRLLMLCRMVIVLGYSLLLGILASTAFAAVSGVGLWEMVQLWLAPLLFLSSLCLTISLFLGSACALVCAAVAEVLQNILASSSSQSYSLSLLSFRIEPEGGPVLLIGAALLITVAIFFIPQQPRPTKI